MDFWNEGFKARSLDCSVSVRIRLVNITNRDLDIMWLNYLGAYVKYATLPRRGFLDLNTYETHPWIACDQKGKNRMLIDKKFIFMPKSLKGDIPDRYRHIPHEHVPPRIVYITIPLYTLRYRALLSVRSNLRSEADIESLDLPTEINDDLKLMYMEEKIIPVNPSVAIAR